MEHPHPIPLEYNQITEHLWLGTNVCCLEHFNEELLAQGIRAEVSLEGERPHATPGVDSFLWLPVEDTQAPTQEQLALGAAHLRELSECGVKTYVHCKWGHGRSPTLLAAYLITTGMQAEEAISHIRERRPGIHPTAPQLAALTTFER